jgi:YggT family protein
MTWQFLLVQLADLYAMILVVYICLTWIPTRQGVFGDVMNFLQKICDPFLAPFRKLIPPIGGMIDITPIIALLVLQFGVRLIVSVF